MSPSSSSSSSNVLDAGDVVDMVRRISLARVRLSFLIGFSQGLCCLVWPTQWRSLVISPISRMVLGFHAVEADDFWEGRDLEEVMAFGGIRGTNWLMTDLRLLDDVPSKVQDLLIV